MALILCLLPGWAAAGAVTVFAAASLKTALDEVAQGFEAETGHQVVLSYAGSPVLARQIALGAPADMFISANPDWMTWLEGEGRIAAQTRVDVLGNRLALIAHGSVQAAPLDDLPALIGDERLAMALVDAVPAGLYGKAALTHLGAWAALEAQVVQADNARAALKLVAIGAARFGVVYATDAAAESAVGLVGLFPPASHPPIVYPAAIVADRDRPEVLALLTHLHSPPARAIFEKHGFTVLMD